MSRTSTASGYVKDEEGKDIDADKLLQNMKDDQEQANKVRLEKGLEALRITRWIERPHYDQASRHLVWSIELETLDASGKVKDTNLNYNTYALGRGGFITLKLVTGVDAVEKDKAHVRELLSNLKFKPGKRHQDFNASTDKVATYGLLALIGGVAVKKLGLLALAGVFFAKFAKIIIGGAVVAFMAFRKLFRRKDEAETVAACSLRLHPPAIRRPPDDANTAGAVQRRRDPEDADSGRHHAAVGQPSMPGYSAGSMRLDLSDCCWCMKWGIILPRGSAGWMSACQPSFPLSEPGSS